jgi:hypothetical protein
MCGLCKRGSHFSVSEYDSPGPIFKTLGQAIVFLESKIDDLEKRIADLEVRNDVQDQN